MPSFVLKTGNLPVALAATAQTHNDKPSFVEAKRDTETLRAVYIGYKVPKDSKPTDKLPANFSVLVSNDVNVSDPDAFDRFTAALVNDYQDKLIHDVADKKTKIDPTDWDAIIKDYFDTSRQRTGPSLDDIEAWATEFWTVAYLARVQQLNEIAASEGKPGQDEKKTKLVVSKYVDWIRLIAKKTCALSRINIQGVRQNIERLIELGLLEQDEIAEFVIGRAIEHIAAIDKSEAEHVEGEV